MRPAVLKLAVLVVAAVLASSGHAQTASVTGSSVQIRADNGIEWRRDQKVHVARGNAVAVRGDFTVRADKLFAFYREAGGTTEFYKLEARGAVEVEMPADTAYGEHGVYHSDRKVAILTGGNLRLEMAGGDIVRARDSLEYWQEFEGRPVAVARGDASMQRENDLIEADTLTASFSEGVDGERELDRVDALGDVRIRTPSEFASGNEGIYYAIEQRAVLAGDVRITQGANQLNGERAEVDLETGFSRLLPGSSGRVQGLLVPGGSDTSTGADN